MTTYSNSTDNRFFGTVEVANSLATTSARVSLINSDTGVGSNSYSSHQCAVGSGDPYVNFYITSTRSFALGIDNTDDEFKLTTSSSSNTPSSGTELIAISSATNRMSQNLQIVSQVYSADSAVVYNSISNPSATGNADASVLLLNNSNSTGDPYINWGTYNYAGAALVTQFGMGIDNSDSDALKIGVNLAGAYPGTPSSLTTTLKMTTSGEITKPLQPCFFFYLNSNTSANVTGDSTGYVLGTDALTQRYQQGSGMSTNGTFTVPVTGWYNFQICVYLYGIGAGHTSGYVLLRVGGTNLSYICSLNPANIANASGEAILCGSIQINRSASDAITFAVVVGGSTKTVGLGGVSSSIYRTFITGSLLY